MKTWLLTAVMGLAAIHSHVAASHSPTWSAGQILLNNGTQIVGELSYNWKAEIVQLRKNGTIKAFSAQQIERFSYFDNASNALRQFSAVDFPVRKTLKRPVFLEEYSTGTFTVYRRLRHVREPLQFGAPGASTEEVLKDNYDSFVYYVYTNGAFYQMDKFNRDLWPQMHDEFGPELKQYASVRQLDINNTAARLMLINQYNYLKIINGSSESYQPVETIVAGDEQPN